MPFLLAELSKAQGTARRVAAVTSACEAFDHHNETRHNIELQHGSVLVLANMLEQSRTTDDELRMMQVLGNGESVYYVLDETDAYIGVNKTICSEMLLNFGNNEITDIRFFTKPNGQFTPMRQANHDVLRLEGFRWLIEQRPMSVEDLR